MTAEKLGVPAVAIMTDAFREPADLMAKVCGMPDYPYAVIDHPISSATDDQLREQARSVVRQVAAIVAQRAAV